MEHFINWNLMRNPWNWPTVLLMALFGSLAAQYIYDSFGSAPSEPEK